MLIAALVLATALATPPSDEAPAPVEIDCDGSEEFCARLRKALMLGEQLESVVEREAFEGVEQVHVREVELRKPLRPKLPVQARVMYQEPVRCAYRVFIDEKGAPYDLRFLNCPTVFHPSVLEALPNAKWAPVRVDGVKVKATFATSTTFKP
ncbi:MAG: hypothetical protein KC912_00840 [Proteobacteria bacterium]|nr:hypothetical protein [Pseudomonadota bacterium]